MIIHWIVFQVVKRMPLMFVLVTGIAVSSILMQYFTSQLHRFGNPGDNFDISLMDEMIWVQYHYNPVRFQDSIARWRDEHPMDYHVLVVLSEPSSPSVSSQSLVSAVHDALSSERAQVVVYLHRHSNSLVVHFLKEFDAFLRKRQLILITSRHKNKQYDNDTATYSVRDDFHYSYLLDLSYQSKSNFTIALRCCGLLLTNYADRHFDLVDSKTDDGHNKDYVTIAVEHYFAIANKEHYITDRICWTHLSSSSDESFFDAILLNTMDHAAHMYVTLRSSLPYQYYKFSDVLNIYCNKFIWLGRIVAGPALFSTALQVPSSEEEIMNEVEPKQGTIDQNRIQLNRTNSSFAALTELIDPRGIGVPDWIDPTTSIGPQINTTPHPYWITFAVTTMIRPNVRTIYLEKFMDGILSLVEAEFQRPDASNTSVVKPRFNATIVLLVSGNTLEDIALLRKFLETQYANAFESSIIRLIDSPLDSHELALRTMRSTFSGEVPERRYWRSKQNLDIGALLGATVGLSDFVMLLEDDVGFKESFAATLKDVMMQDISTESWASADFGFGCAGRLFRGIDVPVYQRMHTTFFNEKPCDLLGSR
jgi:N-Acetylglucosaminyltransferase-IV (GnT-IV) conserved region